MFDAAPLFVKFLRLARSSSRGQLLPIMALSLTALLGASALAVDVGYWRYQQRLEQTAADSAAIAGASEINYPSANDVASAAQNDATLNGFTNNVKNATVTVNQPPLSGPNAGNVDAVEVIITELQPSFFTGIFGTSQTVRARAVAVLKSTSGGCLYALNPSGGVSGNLTLNGGGRGGITSTPLCGMVINGNLTVTGNANVAMSSISYAGSGPTGGSYPNGQPVHSIQGMDPCSNLPGCAALAAITASQISAQPCQDYISATTLVWTLPSPNALGQLPAGHYCGGYEPTSGPNAYKVTGGYTTAVTLAPGLFIMDAGMFAGQTSGTGVTIYNNCKVSATNPCATTLNGGNVNNTITAPTSGPYGSMVYYQPLSLQNTITVNGAAGTVQAIGGVYAPGGNFVFDGQLPSISFLVTSTINMNGGGISMGGPPGGYALPSSAVLAE